MKRPRRPERGFVAIELALAVGVLLIPVALMVLALPTWSQRQLAARTAAGQAALAMVAANDWDSGVAVAGRRVAEVAANHGLDPSSLRLTVTGSLDEGEGAGRLDRDEFVTAHVEVDVPVLVIPGIGSFGSVPWTASRSEHVDIFRNFSG